MKQISRILPLIAMLSPDIAEGTDPLDVNVNDIDISYPRLKPGPHNLKIADAKIEKAKSSDNQNLVVSFETVDTATSTEGNTLNPGHKLTHYIGISPLPERPSPDGSSTYRARTNLEIAKDISAICQAAKITATPREVIANPAILNGNIVVAKVAIQDEKDGFPESNKVRGFVIGKK